MGSRCFQLCSKAYQLRAGCKLVDPEWVPNTSFHRSHPALPLSTTMDHEAAHIHDWRILELRGSQTGSGHNGYHSPKSAFDSPGTFLKCPQIFRRLRRRAKCKPCHRLEYQTSRPSSLRQQPHSFKSLIAKGTGMGRASRYQAGPCREFGVLARVASGCRLLSSVCAFLLRSPLPPPTRPRLCAAQWHLTRSRAVHSFFAMPLERKSGPRGSQESAASQKPQTDTERERERVRTSGSLAGCQSPGESD